LTQPVLAIVGRPNVGKSALFNRIAGRRIAIVHEEAGVTRDRVCAVAAWRGKTFEVVDTGGIAFMDEEKTGDILAASAKRQAEVAIEMADTIVMVTDVTAGVTPLDLEIARKLRASAKRVVLAINKVDNAGREAGVGEFSELGFTPTFAIAAVHGLGVPALLDAATADFSASVVEPIAAPTRVAIVGRPNVGKSSLVNCLLQSDRTIVSDVPGTTRDAVDVPFTVAGQPYVLVDTAGLKHRRKITTSVDQFGLMRAERSIRECDLAVLVLDARDGVTKQDKKIAGQIAAAARACVVLVNKWDLAAEEEAKSRRKKSAAGKTKPKTFCDEYLAALRKELFFLDWAPVVFASAKTGQRVDELFRQIAVIERERVRRVETPELNRTLTRALDAYPPPFVHGRRFKILYAFQKPGPTPTFVLFVNSARCLTPHYERFLRDRIRAAWGFAGCPVVFEMRQREQKSSSKRNENAAKLKKMRSRAEFA
jgi:GTP-binding protein